MRLVLLALATLCGFMLSACIAGNAVGTAVDIAGSVVSTTIGVTGDIVGEAAGVVQEILETGDDSDD